MPLLVLTVDLDHHRVGLFDHLLPIRRRLELTAKRNKKIGTDQYLIDGKNEVVGE
jgi:hypothetical protein